MNFGQWIFSGFTFEKLKKFGWDHLQIQLTHPTNAHVYNITLDLSPQSKIKIYFNQEILYKQEFKPTIHELIDKNCKFISYFGVTEYEDAEKLNNELFNLLTICEKEFPNEEIDLLIRICKEIFTCYFSENINDKKNWDDKLKQLINLNENRSDADTKILISKLDPSKIEKDTILEMTLTAIEKNNFDQLLIQLTLLLQKGYNFFKTSKDHNRPFGMYTPIELIILRVKDNKVLFPIIEKFLQYGLDPTRRIISGITRLSTTEIAIRHQRQDLKEYIGILTNKINRPFDNIYKTFHITSSKDSIITRFIRKDGCNISTRLLNVKNMNKYQKLLCLSYIQRLFKLGAKELKHTYDFFYSNDKNNLVDFLFINNNFAGFHAFEILSSISSRFRSSILIHHYYTIILPVLEKQNIYLLTTAKLYFGLKDLFPELNVVFFSSALNYKVSKVTKHFLKAGKYRFEGFEDYLKDILFRIMNHHANLKTNGNECSIDDGSRLKKEIIEPSTKDIYANLHFEMQGKQPGVAEFIFAEKINRNIASQEIARMGIDFELYAKDFVKELHRRKSALLPTLSVFNRPRVINSENEFWENHDETFKAKI